jgi:hypothetical protein
LAGLSSACLALEALEPNKHEKLKPVRQAQHSCSLPNRPLVDGTNTSQHNKSNTKVLKFICLGAKISERAMKVLNLNPYPF